MSIIEKAVGKLGKSAQQPVALEPVVQAEPAAPEAALIKKAVERVAEQPAATKAPSMQVAESVGSHQITINNHKLKQMGMISIDGERSQIAEEYRLIKRPLLLNAFGQGATPVRNGNMIMVTSSLPGEGKTFCSINLAISIAMELDRTVLLVDADVAKPSVLRYLGVKAEHGLLDVLRDEKLNIGDVLIKTNVENLSSLPAGRT